MGLLRFWRSREVTLFQTHAVLAYPLGKVVEHRGRFYRVTRQVDLAPTRLLNGELRECWSVRGRPIR